VIDGVKAAAVLVIRGRVMEREIRPAHANAIHRSIEPSFQRFAGRVHRELDAR
jgi:hypothetical protein